jgi:pimeloyl-ACP methyl ester carboxylesterase
MVACEMARHLRASAILLVASATTRAAIPVRGRLLAAAAARVPPFRPPPVWLPLAAWAFGASTSLARHLLSEFMQSAPPAFVQWGLEAVRRWRPPSAPPAPLFHIHGGADRIIPVKRVNPGQVVAGAGHFINLTHPVEVNDFMRRLLDRN